MNYNRTNIIASLATTPGISAITVIRISGPNLSQLYTLITQKKTYKNRYASYTKIFHDDQKTVLDRCIVIYYSSPNSYTGEDVIEINCHGGKIISQSILNMLYAHGAKPALPGEFSYRAFLNNKIDLIEAEAISSLINSSSEYSNEIIMDHLNKKLSDEILNINSKIINVLTIIEHELDFSEDEIDHTTNKTILDIIEKISITINKYLKNKNFVKTITNGINIVILGVPNAGKSSLFNNLVGKERTIVSNSKGTTRDTIQSTLLINQYLVNLMDTAGYFDADDQINIDSVKQTMDNAKKADIIIFLDENNPKKEFEKINIKSENVIHCMSKQDNIKQESNNGTIYISSKTGAGINKLKKKISTILSTQYQYDFKKDKSLISERQIVLFKRANKTIETIKESLKLNIGMDIIASQMHELTAVLDECVGRVSNEDILNSIFNNFCVGK